VGGLRAQGAGRGCCNLKMQSRPSGDKNPWSNQFQARNSSSSCVIFGIRHVGNACAVCSAILVLPRKTSVRVRLSAPALGNPVLQFSRFPILRFSVAVAALLAGNVTAHTRNAFCNPISYFRCLFGSRTTHCTTHCSTHRPLRVVSTWESGRK